MLSLSYCVASYWSMKRSLRLLLVLIAKLAIIHLVHAQNQQGFSLDCGLSEYEPSPYNEVVTGLQFYSDATFIKSGKTGVVQNTKSLKPYNTLRYFPKGIRNCYSVNVEKGIKYKIKAHFLYGNYDGRNTTPNFDLYLGPNIWATIDLDKTYKEIIHIPTSNKLQVCLVKTGVTTPMISALEIQPMGDDSYITWAGSLNLYLRYYFTNLHGANDEIRYPDDVYDRQWIAHFDKDWTPISTTSDVANSNHYKPPKKALATAAIPTNASEPLRINWTNSDNPNARYYLYSHIAEIQDLQDNETREFNIVFNGEVINKNSTLERFSILTFYMSYGRICEGGVCSFQLERTNRSTHPPLLNAFEAYTSIHFPQAETDETDVDVLKDITTTYALSRVNWQGDPCVPQHLRWDSLNCSNTNMSTPPRITSLNLSSSGLSGNIAAAIQNLTQLERLDLSNNNLTGGLPEFLGKMKLLSFINLSGNDLNGSIPQVLQKKGIELFVDGNPRLCVTDSCPKPPKKKFLVAKAIIASVTFAAIIIAVLVFFLILRKKQPKILEGSHIQRSSIADDTFANKKSKRFTYSDVIAMTGNFQRVLGKGGFGMVYQGTLNGSKQVAVKVVSQSSAQGYKEFKAEVDLLLRVHHTNLVSLIGYCYEGDRLALIYEFLPNGDLKQHLSGRGGRSIMDWATRLRIALEAALGLEYLHVGCTPPMVHRDVKTANILLDENFKAKIADFGLIRSFQGEGESQVSTDLAGTPGYFDPEYFVTHRLSEKSDVYSFGIVLLELITNQPVTNHNQTSENCHIAQWVGFKVNLGDITEIMDPKLGRDYDNNSAWRALDLAMSCSNPSSSQRPSMSQVVQELKSCIACVRSGLSNSRGLEVNVVVDTSVVPRAR